MNNDFIIDALRKITGFMNLECQIEIHEDQSDGKSIFISLYAPEHGKFLIGKNGQSLKALEHVVRLLYARSDEDIKTITLDVNDYKKLKAVAALEQAKLALQRVRSTQKAEALLPMTAYERRVVHMELAACPDITTESIGEEPQRRIVIKPFP